MELITIFLGFSLLVRGALGSGEIVCEDLSIGMCAYSVASSGKRCSLESYESIEGRRGYQCKTSVVLVSNIHITNLIESDECRLDITIDVVSAIDYLHNGYSTPVVHCDLKPNNVLIDQEIVAHVSDFGIAKMLGTGEAFVQTRTIATIGYIAPEYGQDGIVSKSCDIYSFGILMMETFTRIKPTDEVFTGDLSIQRWVSDSIPSRIHKVVDSNLIQPGDKQIDLKMQCLLSIMELALSCTLVTPDARISMEDALSTLKKIRLQLVSSLH